MKMSLSNPLITQTPAQAMPTVNLRRPRVPTLTDMVVPPPSNPPAALAALIVKPRPRSQWTYVILNAGEDVL